jgi:hypothetical protein
MSVFSAMCRCRGEREDEELLDLRELLLRSEDWRWLDLLWLDLRLDLLPLREVLADQANENVGVQVGMLRSEPGKFMQLVLAHELSQTDIVRRTKPHTTDVQQAVQVFELRCGVTEGAFSS